MQSRLRVKTLQGAIEKSPVLFCNIRKMNNWIAHKNIKFPFRFSHTEKLWWKCN